MAMENIKGLSELLKASIDKETKNAEIGFIAVGVNGINYKIIRNDVMTILNTPDLNDVSIDLKGIKPTIYLDKLVDEAYRLNPRIVLVNCSPQTRQYITQRMLKDKYKFKIEEQKYN